MKKLIISLAFLTIFFFVEGSGVTDNKKDIETDKKRIEVSLNRTMDFNDLVMIKLDLAENGITINYKLLEFDENNGLRTIDFKVDCHDGFSGSARNTNVQNQSKFGFYRDYDENSASPFGTGNLN